MGKNKIKTALKLSYKVRWLTYWYCISLI